MREYISLPIFFTIGIIAFILGQPLLGLLRSIIKQHILAGELLIPLLLWPFLIAIVLYAIKRSFKDAVIVMLLAFLASAITYSPTLLINSSYSSPYIGYLMLLIPISIPLIFILLSIRYGFVWRATGISYIALILSFFVFFFISAAQHTDTLHVQKIEPPTDSVNLTGLLEYPDEFPILKKKLKAKLDSESVRIELPPEEFFKLKDVVNNSKFVKINDNYYTIGLSKNLAVRRLAMAENYTDVSEEEMKSYPVIEELINSLEETLKSTKTDYGRVYYGKGNVSREEVYEVMNFLKENGNSIRYNGKYYEVILDLRLSLNRYEYPPVCPEFTEEKLSKYPFLEKAVKEASIKGKAYVDTNALNWRSETGFEEHCIKYRGEYYGVGVMTP